MQRTKYTVGSGECYVLLLYSHVTICRIQYCFPCNFKYLYFVSAFQLPIRVHLAFPSERSVSLISNLKSMTLSFVAISVLFIFYIRVSFLMVFFLLLFCIYLFHNDCMILFFFHLNDMFHFTVLQVGSSSHFLLPLPWRCPLCFTRWSPSSVLPQLQRSALDVCRDTGGTSNARVQRFVVQVYLTVLLEASFQSGSLIPGTLLSITSLVCELARVYLFSVLSVGFVFWIKAVLYQGKVWYLSFW